MKESAVEYPRSLPEARAAGSKFYYTGKPCRHGNIELRLTSAGACWCGDCRKLHSGRVNSWQKRNPEKVLPRTANWRAENKDHVRVYLRDYKDSNRRRERERHLFARYGITMDDYEAILSAQGGKCSLCSTPAESSARKRLFVDHCHGTGRVRGLLCDDCNKSLGVIEKYRDKLTAMLDYADNAEAGRIVRAAAECDAQVRGLQAVVLADRKALIAAGYAVEETP